jgi:hypothetical protein
MNPGLPGWKNKARSIWIHIAWILVICVFYWLMFHIRLPPQIKKRGILIVDELMILALFLSVYLTYKREDALAKYIVLFLILAAFTLPILRLWETAESTWNIVLGLLPWADATGYYWDASNLIEGNLFSVFSGRRPIFASLLAVFLKLSNQNLQIVLIIFLIVNGLTVFFFTEEIRAEFGPLSAIAALYLLHFFYRPFAGTTLTEQLGLPIGLLALVVLMRAVKTSQALLFSLGLMLMMFALLIRAGTFFVLPILILFGTLYLANGRQQYIKIFLILIASVIIPVLVNSWLGHVVASPASIQFGNFADTLYGQAKGGVRWTQAMIDHPELADVPEPDRSRRLYRLAFEEFLNHPLGFVKGSIKAWKDFIVPSPISAFGFLNVGNKQINLLLQISASLLFLVGLWLLWRDRRKPISAFLLACEVGLLISIPFLPPLDAGIRPYAATIALVCLPPIFVFSRPFFQRKITSFYSNQFMPIGTVYSLAFFLLLTSIAGGPLIKMTASHSFVQTLICQSGLIPIHFKLTRGSYVLLSSNAKTAVPIVSIKDIHPSFDDFAYSDFATVLRRMKQPMLISTTEDLTTGAGMWVIAPPLIKDQEGQIISACADNVLPKYSVLEIRTLP